jgi:cytidine deaminase
MRKAKIEFDYEIYTSSKELLDEERELLEKAKETMQTAYAPYSKFRVGAAVMLKNNKIITGSNQENAAYPSGLCAERVALFSVGAKGKEADIKKIAIIGTNENFKTTQPPMPCGACRQVLKEYQDLTTEPIIILTSGTKGEIYRFNGGVNDLLPLAFGPGSLRNF